MPLKSPPVAKPFGFFVEANKTTQSTGNDDTGNTKAIHVDPTNLPILIVLAVLHNAKLVHRHVTRDQGK